MSDTQDTLSEAFIKKVFELVALKEKIAEIKENQLKDLEDEAKALSNSILREMGDNDLTKVEYEDAKVTKVSRKGSSLDKEAVCKALGVADLKQYMVDGTPTEYLKITLNKDN